jgi:cytoplasmic iron level regulating protein YaaA (DUF328/UPF0246 family)
VDVPRARPRRQRRRAHAGEAPLSTPSLAILLPPSEGKAFGGALPGWDPTDGRFGPALAAPRRRVARALAKAKGGDQKLLGVGGATLERARAANRSVIGAPVLAAGDRFTGVVWDHLALDELRGTERHRARESIFVVSALAGLVTIDDPLPDHRLKLSVSLGALGRVAGFWREPLSAALNDALDGRLVIDLLPGEHAAAWEPDRDRYDLRRVRLLAEDGRAVGHAAKAAKGTLAHELLCATNPEQVLKRWTHPEFALAID